MFLNNAIIDDTAKNNHYLEKQVLEVHKEIPNESNSIAEHIPRISNRKDSCIHLSSHKEDKYKIIKIHKKTYTDTYRIIICIVGGVLISIVCM